MNILRRGLASVVLLLLNADAVPAAGEHPDDFYQDFRGGRFQDALFQKVGRDPGRQVRPEAGGLRITLPAGPQSYPQTGILPRFQVRGDFEITLSYDILALEPPKTGYGSGVMLWIQAGEKQGTAAIARRHRVKEGSVYVADRATEQANGPPQHDEQFFSTRTKSGKLRLQRSGETIHYLVAKGASESFQELRQISFGTADLVAVRVMADPGGSRSTLDVLLKDLRFHTEKLPLAGGEKSERNWLIWLVVAGLLGFTIAMVLWWKRKHRLAAQPAKASRPKANPVASNTTTPFAAQKRGDGSGR